MNEANLESLMNQCESTALVLKALAHPRRLQILCLLATRARTVGELEADCGISQSQLSQFLQRMRAEGLVAFKRDGKFVRYSIADPRVLKLIRALHRVFCPEPRARATPTQGATDEANRDRRT